MTVEEMFKQKDINFEMLYKGKKVKIYSLKTENVMFWFNDNNIYKMKKGWFEVLSRKDKYTLVLWDAEKKNYYYIKFDVKNNWLSNSFLCSDKQELFLGKQVLNYKRSLSQILSDIKKNN